MKRTVLMLMMAVGTFMASAQKIGYVNTDELIGLMPEAAAAQKTLNEFQQGLSLQGQDMLRDLNTKDSSFNADSSKMSASMKEIKKKELVDMYQKWQAFQQRDAQDQLQAKTDEMVAPIREKALAAIRAVAKKNNYAYVMEEGNLIVMPPADDLTPLVRTELGIKAPAAQTSPATKPAAGRTGN